MDDENNAQQPTEPQAPYEHIHEPIAGHINEPFADHIETIESFLTDASTPDYYKCPASGSILREPVVLPHSGDVVSKLEAEKHDGVDFLHNDKLTYNKDTGLTHVNTVHLDKYMKDKIKQVLNSEMATSFKKCVHMMALLKERNDLQYTASTRQCFTKLFWKDSQFLSLFLTLNVQERETVFFTVTKDGFYCARYLELFKKISESSTKDPRINGLYELFPSSRDVFNVLQFEGLLFTDSVTAGKLLTAFLKERNFNLFEHVYFSKEPTNERVWAAIREISKRVEQDIFETICRALPFEQHIIATILSTSPDPILLAQREQVHEREISALTNAIQQHKQVHEREISSLTNTIQQHKQAHEREISSLTNTIQQHKQEVSSLTSAIQQHKQEVSSLTATSQQQQEAIAALTASIQQLKDEITALKPPAPQQ